MWNNTSLLCAYHRDTEAGQEEEEEILSIENIHILPSISIDFVLSFPQSDLGVNVFVEIPLGMGVDGKRREQFLKLNKSLYGIKQASSN